jgi:hypothetical protein
MAVSQGRGGSFELDNRMFGDPICARRAPSVIRMDGSAQLRSPQNLSPLAQQRQSPSTACRSLVLTSHLMRAVIGPAGDQPWIDM